MKSMADAIRAEGKGYLLGPTQPCGFCHIRRAQVGDICCFCAKDEESREQYAAQQAALELEDE